MSYELDLCFPDTEHVEVSYDGLESTGLLPFTAPLTTKDYSDIRWYVETYGAYSIGEPDDAEAARINAKLTEIGKALFQSVFQHPAAQRLFNAFQNARQQNRHLTISTGNPAILALPWELLHDSQMHLFHQSINLRRRLDGTQNTKPFASKPRLHLLFVISRPQDAGFIDPRADAKPVLDALDEYAQARISTEFLHPATLQALQERLQDMSKPAVDILHFDGHGSFDEDTQSGSLLFERATGINYNAVSADNLGPMLRLHNIPLVILSACQSATQGEEPLGCVATGLLGQGIPAVLAMTHKVLVKTTEAFFGAFYQTLGEGKPLGLAMKQAREFLDNHPDKQQVRRGQDWVQLKMHDWFVPALYQSGEDQPLLEPQPTVTPFAKWGLKGIPQSKLSTEPQAGFFGRSLELWQIERSFALKTRRITITGFGGQGKTALAQEAARWLLRTGQFQAAAFVTYADLQTLDSVAIALNTLGEVLGESFPNPAAALEALRKTPTLLILDNLETLQPEPLKELLDSAVDWSQAGGSRVLLTSHSPDFRHPAYPVAGSLDYLRVSLQGLGNREYPHDALAWFGELQKRPPAPELPAPTRDELISLFDKVGFHPLSIHILAVQLKTRRVEELGERLEQVLLEPRLIACLQPSLECLTQKEMALLSNIGIFQGGAFESMLLTITGIEDKQWSMLRSQLEATALLESERLKNVISEFLRFPPSLAPFLWTQLNEKQRQNLSTVYQSKYYALAGTLYYKDAESPLDARIVALPELPNLLHALRLSKKSCDVQTPEFVKYVRHFFALFGLSLDAQDIVDYIQELGIEENQNKDTWYSIKCQLGDSLLEKGNIEEAEKIYKDILAKLDGKESYHMVYTLNGLAQCSHAAGQSNLSAKYLFKAMSILVSLDLKEAEEWKIAQKILLTKMSDLLRECGYHEAAHNGYKLILALDNKQNDLRGYAVTLNQLGNLAFSESDFDKALEFYLETLRVFKLLNEPKQEAMCYMNLGKTYTQLREWKMAEESYRKGANILIKLEDMVGAASAWNDLAVMNHMHGNKEMAEHWYREAIALGRATRSPQSLLAHSLNNLANLLLESHHKLNEALKLAEESLSIKKNLNVNAMAIWQTYKNLSDISSQLARSSENGREQRIYLQKAFEYRRLALDAYKAYPGNKTELRRHARFIRAACLVCRSMPNFSIPWYRRLWIQSANENPPIELVQWRTIGFVSEELAKLRIFRGDRPEALLAEAVDRLLAGERSSEVLCAKLDTETARIIISILQGIANPESLVDLYNSAHGQDQVLQGFASFIIASTAICRWQSNSHLPWYRRWRRKPTIAIHSFQSEDRAELSSTLAVLRLFGPDQPQGFLANAVGRLLEGERDADVLLDGLDYDTALIIETILQGIADPASLDWLTQEPGAEDAKA